MLHPIVHLYHYTRRPVYRETNERLPFKVWLSFFGLSLVLAVLVAALLINLGISPDNPAKSALQFTPFVNFCIIAILGPLLEESAFRMPLRAGKQAFFVASTALTYIVATNFVYHTRNYDLGHDFPTRVMVSFAVGALVWVLADKWSAQITSFWKKHFRAVYYCAAGIFAYMHLLNFDIATVPWYEIPFATLPQIISALILGYVRMHYGFRNGFLLHAGLNGIPELLFGPLLHQVFGY